MLATTFLFKSILCSALLYLYYWLLLRNRKEHQYNRVYLLTATVFSIVLPFLHFHVLPTQTATSRTAIQVVQTIASHAEADSIISTGNVRSNYDLLIRIAYTLVSLILLVVASMKLIWIYRLKQTGKATLVNGTKIVVTKSPKAPFSFLSTIYWKDTIDLNSEEGQRVLAHEVTHVRQWHTLDKLFMQAVLICCWVNPFYWLMQKELSLVHEYLADEAAVNDQDTDAFARMLLHTHYGYIVQHIVNPFYYSSIKKRIFMLNKPRTANSRIRKLMAVPMLAGTVALFSFTAKTAPHEAHAQKITIILDAGHGGNDAGAIATNGIKEKDLNLRICKRIAELAGQYNITVIQTRSTDQFITLQERSQKANAEHAQLLISIHVNTGNVGTPTNGLYEVTTSGKNAYIAQSRLLASAIIPQLQSQGLRSAMSERGLHILNSSNMPSVLIECGNINDGSDVAMINDNAKLDDLCNNILKGVEQFSAAK